MHASGPVLCLHFNPVRPELLLATCMNGGHSVLHVERDPEVAAAVASGATSAAVAAAANTHDATFGPAVLHTAVDHKKFVVTGKWSPDGKYYATGSHDFTVNVYAAKSVDTWLRA